MNTMLTDALGHHQAGRLREAETLCRQILEANPDHPDALHLRGVLALQAGHGDEAIRFIERSVELNPNNADALNNLGLAFTSLGRQVDAVAVYRKAIALVPDFAQAQSNLGDAFIAEGNPEEAIACYEHVLESHPHEPQILNNLGNALASLGNLKDAIAHFRHALEASPEDPVILTNLGNALQEDGSPEEIIKAFERALVADPDFVEAHSSMGKALKKLGRLEEATSCFQRAVDLNPDFLDAQDNLIAALKEGGFLHEAARTLRKSISDNPNNAEDHFRLGMIVYEIGELEEAEKHYRQAIDLKPGLGRAHYHLGNLFRKVGRLDSAITCFNNMLERDPQFAEIALNSNKHLNGLAKYLRTRPVGTRNLHNLRVFHGADIEGHCTQSKTELNILDGLKVQPIGSEHPAETGPALFLAELKDGGVLGGSCLPVTRSGDVFFNQLTHNANRLAAASSYQNRVSVLLANEKQIAVAADEEKEYSGPHLLLGSHGNFGHWLLNHFSRLLLVRDREDLKSLPVIVAGELSGARLECLTRVGYGKDRIIRVPPGQIAWFEHLWVPSFPFFAEQKTNTLMWAPEASHFIRSALGVPLERQGDKPPRRLFITRRNAKWRYLKDEDKIFAAIQPFGFELIDPGDLSLEEQINIASEAEIIMGAFGAAMNLHQFAPQGTHVVELKLEQVEMDIHPTIATEIGQFHHSIFCKNESTSRFRLNDNLIAPIDEVISLAKTLSRNA